MQRLLAEFRGDRDERRRALIMRINPAALVDDALARRRGALARGRDGHGNPVRTLHPDNLHLKLDFPLVSFDTARDDKEVLQAMPRGEADALVKRRRQHRNSVRVTTDVFRAVRIFGHMRDSYRAEFLATATIEYAESLNAELAAAAPADIKLRADALIGSLDSLEAALSQVSTGSKLIAMERLGEARAALEQAKGLQTGFELQSRIGPACALLVAARRRFGLRDEEILERGSRAYLRECCIRPVRDGAIETALSAWINLLSNDARASSAMANWETDMGVIRALETATRSTSGEALRFAAAARIPVKKFQRQLDKASACFGSYNLADALKEMRLAALALAWNKPQYIIQQVEKTGDAYLVDGPHPQRTFIAYLKISLQAFRVGAMPRAQYCAQKALELLPKA